MVKFGDAVGFGTPARLVDGGSLFASVAVFEVEVMAALAVEVLETGWELEVNVETGISVVGSKL